MPDPESAVDLSRRLLGIVDAYVAKLPHLTLLADTPLKLIIDNISGLI